MEILIERTVKSRLSVMNVEFHIQQIFFLVPAKAQYKQCNIFQYFYNFDLLNNSIHQEKCMTSLIGGWDGEDWIGLAQDSDKWRALVNAVMNLWVHKILGNYEVAT
jgi:hypothetical protein